MSERVRPRIERKEEKDSYLIVEVGSGALEDSHNESFWVKNDPTYRAWFENNESAQYVGVDINPENLTRVQNETPAHERIAFVRADATKLPFADSSVSELVLKNVLGDPDIPVETKHAVLHESARVLKHGALLKLIEVYTPIVVWEEDLEHFIDTMPEKPFTALTKSDIDALEPHERASAEALRRDRLAEETFKLGESFASFYRRT